MKPSQRDIHREINRALRLRVTGRVLTVLAALYLGFVWLDCVTTKPARKVLPRPVAYFTQIAGLFPHAATVAIEYRAEGWSCRDHRWVELDPSPDFPIDADNKENRFYRAMHFHHEDRGTLEALERFMISRHNWRRPDNLVIGGVRLSSLRIPFGKPGEPAERYERRPIDAYPAALRKEWYKPSKSTLEDRCKELGA